MSTEFESWLILNRILNDCPSKFRKLVEFFGTAERVLSVSDNDLMLVEGIDEKVSKSISNQCREIDIQKEIEETKKNGVKVIASFMDEYPKALKNIYDYPPVIYLKGSFEKSDSVAMAVVGTRMMTSYGKNICEYITKELVNAGITVVSGLARGIDTISHRMCIEEKGRTIAVLGNGLNNHYPPENRKLEDKIIENGALISEFAMNVRPDKANFPRRNRLISGLSMGVIVVEADEKSGALITAKFAVEQGKDVFAVPGNIYSKYSKGPHKLIKNGAKLVETFDDIINEINVLKNFVKNTQKNIRILKENKNLNKESKIVLESMGNEPIHIDLLADKTEMQVEKLSVILLGLVMDGFISELHGKNYIKKYN